MATGDESKPTPDPTILTTEQLLRVAQSERDYADGQIAVLRQRLDAMDEATKVLNETVNRVPTDVQQAVSHLRELVEEKFASVAVQFKERDTRAERESRDNKVAVDAAFAAQKEAAAKQDEANQKAIDKSERATTETINKLAELFKTTTDALADKIEDVKTRQGSTELTVNGMQQNRVGGQEVVTERRMSQGAMIAVLGAIFGAVAIVFVVASFIIANGK